LDVLEFYAYYNRHIIVCFSCRQMADFMIDLKHALA